MKTITKKHILIVEMEVLQSETNPEHLQTQLRVLNEMTYEKYSSLVSDSNTLQQLKHLILDDLKAQLKAQAYAEAEEKPICPDCNNNNNVQYLGGEYFTCTGCLNQFYVEPKTKEKAMEKEIVKGLAEERKEHERKEDERREKENRLGYSKDVLKRRG